jgi:hypothetical protein
MLDIEPCGITLSSSSIIVQCGLFAAEGLFDEALALAFPFDAFRGFGGLVFEGNMSAI